MSKRHPGIRLRGNRQNNLKGWDVEIPLGKLTVVTGLSGAGKSSFAFETLHAEGQRRYVETFNSYSRQFLEMLEKPQLGHAENIRPSIAIEQRNAVKTSRSTVGTMTELCDFFKVWFSHRATLIDPADGRPIRDDRGHSIWKTTRETRAPTCLVCFDLEVPSTPPSAEVLSSLSAQGYTRVILDQRLLRVNELEDLSPGTTLTVVQDRITLHDRSRARFIEAVDAAFRLGGGRLSVRSAEGSLLAPYSQGLRSPVTGRQFRSPIPALFSYNSPLGACPTCRGFGRVIEIDPQLVIPDVSLSIEDGAIRPFTGKVYQECLRDLRRHHKRLKIRLDVPWEKLTERERALVWEGEEGSVEGVEDWMAHWYGIGGFFKWLERKAYKMHVRVFLSKFRAYRTCPDCRGKRLSEESLCWQWNGKTLADLYEMPVDELHREILAHPEPAKGSPQAKAAWESMVSRLHFMVEMGLGYLTLNRTSRTLSGGETERVSLTACLGAAVVETLFVLDEPSVGLHPRDIERLIGTLRKLAESGNTVVVVEHDEAIIEAADHLLEIGPEPGERGGHLVFSGSVAQMKRAHRTSLTGAYLTGHRRVNPPAQRRAVKVNHSGVPVDGPGHPILSIYGASCHNIQGLDLHLPLGRLVCLSGVSGSGKSTVLDEILYRNLLRQRGVPGDEPARISDLELSAPLHEIVLIDQSPVGKTPRSTPAVYSGAWELIRKRLAATEAAQGMDLTPSHFSFNSGEGRCPHCEGRGYEAVEMQFLSDLEIPCPVCGGKRFRPEILSVVWNGHSVDQLLEMEIAAVCAHYGDDSKLRKVLQPLLDCGLGYLKMGQPVTTLSGGENQRLKLIRHLRRLDEPSSHPSLILLDEPTTGLHRHDVGVLLRVLQRLVEYGHSLVVIEHHPDVLEAADWIMELGPEAGRNGGRIVAQGPPETIAVSPVASAPYLKRVAPEGQAQTSLAPLLKAAEHPTPYRHKGPKRRTDQIVIEGARHHNLQNLNLSIPRRRTTVITGVSGSGKSTLAFDLVFAEGQRRFMEAMSPYARQFVEQLPKPEVDRITGLAPSVAIEQRVTRGTLKSTVATITEVAQYLRLLYARVADQVNPATGNAVASVAPEVLQHHALQTWKKIDDRHAFLCAPLVRGRKGHFQPLADWARSRGFSHLRCDGQLRALDSFEKLDRYKEHDVDLVLARGSDTPSRERAALIERALKEGKGRFYLLDGKREIHFSTTRTDPATGESFPEPEPKLFSWNSPRGWCPTCHGNGVLIDEKSTADTPVETVCPDCGGDRLQILSRHFFLTLRNGHRASFPDLLRLTAPALIQCLAKLRLDARGKAVAAAILPEIEARLRFMEKVGLEYLTLDRATRTLSGGEAQRIRLAGQLGQNLSGVLYVLDEPTIGLHSRDNDGLIEALSLLRRRDNTVLIVEHDESIMRQADHIIDLGPGAGVEGGRIMAQGTLKAIMASPHSPTGQSLSHPPRHPLRGHRRALPAPRSRSGWLQLEGIRLRNLRGFDLKLPLGRLIGICGVSGSGKSTLVHDVLKPAVMEAIRTQRATLRGGKASPFTRLLQAHHFSKVVEVDQSPIGKTPRSTPATYIGAFDLIRQHFAALPQSRVRGFSPSSFSFNTPGGRCPTCNGAGQVKLEMNFLPDSYMPCEDCGGDRFGPEINTIRWKEKSISDVLRMTFTEAAAFFDFDRRLSAMLTLMVENGLGYLQLGQPSPTLSGGEAQRMKMVSELVGSGDGSGSVHSSEQRRILYLLEEPTIGLHLKDCQRLTELLHHLVDRGHTVVVIEHQLNVLAEADYLVELGPGGGEAGGKRLYQGGTTGLINRSSSPTAPYLKPLLSE